MKNGKQKVALTFALYDGEVFLRRESLTQEIVKIGKDARSHLRVDDELASRMHAVLEVASADDMVLIDLGNEPGTLVRGARVNKTRISVGDAIQIGRTKIVLERAEPVDASVAEAFQDANPFAGGANPFAGFDAEPFASGVAFASATVDEVAADAPEGSYTYSMLNAGPPVADEEVESGAMAVEVMVLWDRLILHVEHLTPPRSFVVGEEQGSDYFVPAEKLGASRALIVLATRDRVSVVFMPGAAGTIEIGGRTTSLADAVAAGQTQPCSERAGALQMPLPVGSKARIVLDNGLTFQISTVHAGRKVAGHVAMAAAPVAFMGLSGAVHAGLLTAMFLFMPGLATNDEGSMASDQDYMLSLVLRAESDRQNEETETPKEEPVVDDKHEGGTGTASIGESGAMGNPTVTAVNKRYAVKGPANNEDPHIAKQAALKDAMEFGMIGLLNTGAGGDPDAPTAIWGRDTSLGIDEKSARGNMWGSEIGDAFGNGLGLTGVGEGGGGRGEGIGVGSLGTIGHGTGWGTADGAGNGGEWGHTGVLLRTHKTQPPSVRIQGTKVSGRLPPEVIQRVVRQNFGRFRLCYENGLRTSPNLQGTVAVSFAIGADGAVANVSGGGSLPDAGVVGCVTKAFYGLSFPAPEGGVVKVTYPIAFSPGVGESPGLNAERDRGKPDP